LYKQGIDLREICDVIIFVSITFLQGIMLQAIALGISLQEGP